LDWIGLIYIDYGFDHIEVVLSYIPFVCLVTF
jgi:hypothetical protein